MRPICVTCGTQFGDSAMPPPGCPICEDERQWVRWEGQAWTDHAALAQGHALRIADDHGFVGFDIQPAFAIGQRAMLVETPAGNMLWDCVSLVTPQAVDAIRARGGLAGIAISHPHFYAAMGEWSDAFGGVPIHLHADDFRWVMRPHSAIRAWRGDTLALLPGLTLIRVGGHFDGGSVLHREGDGGDLFVGDMPMVCQDRRSLGFMRSYPNYIPLNAASVTRVADRLAPYRFARIHGAFRDKCVAQDGNDVLARSVERYRAAIG